MTKKNNTFKVRTIRDKRPLIQLFPKLNVLLSFVVIVKLVQLVRSSNESEVEISRSCFGLFASSC